ncbi:glycosyltransferase [Tieghemostelium lacteum]|uniref:Fucosyltransferase n=1 Tax=Tieghemostelium lacteum TaxID=361077 RepID=A0A152A407_TIELA|nr:glycosyltransferase [Tieghemostelium lacteum]|eukprot:KYR00807.1 glycosyltransferase [Tieghemostelium lacteum]
MKVHNINQRFLIKVIILFSIFYFLFLVFTYRRDYKGYKDYVEDLLLTPIGDEIVYLNGLNFGSVFYLHGNYSCIHGGKEYSVIFTMDKEMYEKANMVMYFDSQIIHRDFYQPPPLNNKISILHGSESPQNSHCFSNAFCVERFNWTISLTGDMKHWYFNSVSAFPIKDNNRENRFDFNRDVWSKKMRSDTNNLSSIGDSGIVAWIASNCEEHVYDNRLEYIKEMMNYIRVDSYGKCLNNIQMKEDGSTQRTSKNLVVQKYKFYLAFENSLCENYITEKTLDCLELGVVPVIMAHPSALKILPKGSYIYAGDYKSSKDLAKYLKYLDENDIEYQKYFNWRTNSTSIEQWYNALPIDVDACVIFNFYQNWKNGKFPMHKNAPFLDPDRYCLPYDYFRIK